MRVYNKSHNLLDAIKFSNIAVNIRYMKCEYPRDVMAKYDEYMGGVGGEAGKWARNWFFIF